MAITGERIKCPHCTSFDECTCEEDIQNYKPPKQKRKTRMLRFTTLRDFDAISRIMIRAFSVYKGFSRIGSIQQTNFPYRERMKKEDGKSFLVYRRCQEFNYEGLAGPCESYATLKLFVTFDRNYYNPKEKLTGYSHYMCEPCFNHGLASYIDKQNQEIREGFTEEWI